MKALMLVALLLVAGVSSALAQQSRSLAVLRDGQTVRVAHSDIFSPVGRVKPPANWLAISCYETRSGLWGSYEVLLTEHDIWVERHTRADRL
jgi:hypothetical protein